MLIGAAIQANQAIGAAKVAKIEAKTQKMQVDAYNKAVANQAAKSFNQINLQKASLTAQVQEALYTVEQQGLVAKSQRGLQAAGTDTYGASVEQNLLDVDLKVDQAQNALEYNATLTDMSLDAQAQAVADGVMFRPNTGQVQNSWSAALGGVMASVGVSLFENKAKTGTFFGSRTGRNQGIDTSADLGDSPNS
jgi:hypothetical protein